MSAERYAKTETAAWLGIAGNATLALLKGIVGFMSQSKALMADAAHSATETVHAINVYVGVKKTKRGFVQQDLSHYKKAEITASIVVSLFFLLIGFEIGLNAVKSMLNGVSTPPAWYALVAIAVSMIVKEVMFQYKYRLERKLRSKFFAISSWKHRSNVYSSTIVFVGVMGAIAGGVWEISILYYLDPLAGLFVALLLLRVGFKSVTESLQRVMEQSSFIKEDGKAMILVVQQLKGIIAVEELHAIEQGHYVVVDVKINVNPGITVMEGERIARAVKYHLMVQFSHVTDVMVQVSPYDHGYPYNNDINAQDTTLMNILQ